MNYLLHLHLSDPDPECQLGNLFGDFVKGRLDQTRPPGIRRGLAMHRRVDAFAHDHPACRRSRLRLDPAFGHLRGVMVDIFYDHLLARNWARHHTRPLEEFAAAVYRLLEERFHQLPESFQPVARAMIAHDWLVSYRQPAVIGRVLKRISSRLSRPNLLASGLPELLGNYEGLEEDCEAFLAAAEEHLREWQKDDGSVRPGP